MDIIEEQLILYHNALSILEKLVSSDIFSW